MHHAQDVAEEDDMSVLAPKDGTPEPDRRDENRISGLRSGVAVSVDGSEREACVVGNMSQSGALLLVEQSERMPEQILLIIDGENVRRPARIVWRRPNAIAVSFLSGQKDDETAEGWIFPPAQ